MKLYKTKDAKTGENKFYLSKTKLCKDYGVNLDRLELAILKNKPLKKRNGEVLEIEYRDFSPNIDEVII